MSDFKEELNEIRKSIDNLDNAMMAVLAERFRLTQRVGELKAAHQMPPQDRNREQRQDEKIRALAQQYGLDADVASRVLRCIIDEVIKKHEKISKDHRRNGKTFQ